MELVSLSVLFAIFNLTFGQIDETFLTEGNKLITCGKIIDTRRKTLVDCSINCLPNPKCKGIMFNKTATLTQRCKLVTSECTSQIYASDWEGYRQYSSRGNYSKFTSVPSLNSTVEQQWPPGFPVCYFPLDSNSIGNALGQSPTAIDFTPDGVYGNAFSFVNPSGSLRAYYNLGKFPSPGHCFTTPDRCKLGMSISFWLNILEEIPSSTFNGFITTIPAPKGPGFLIYWNTSDSMNFLVRREDSVSEYVQISAVKFNMNYGFGKWVHYTMTYHFNANEPKHNMDVFINGVSRQESEKGFYFDSLNTDTNTGDLEMSKHFTNNPAGSNVHMKLDDIIIWEFALPCHDVIQLYQAYVN